VFDLDTTHAFLSHWQSLRRGSDIPQTNDYFDHIDTRLAPLTIMFDCTGSDVVVRFQGTMIVERWGEDRTSESWLSRKPTEEARACALANMHLCVIHPCGVLAKSIYHTKFGQTAQLETLALPLAAREDRPKRLVMLSSLQKEFGERDGVKDRIVKESRAWFDVGLGVPQNTFQALG
jgi:hypothetical protein